MSSLKDKAVLITGASSGIGLGTAEHLAGLGARLVLAGRDAAALARAQESCLAKGAPAVTTVVAELTKEEDRERLIKEAVAAGGGLDVLVNCAGSVVTGTVEDSPLSDLDWIMDVNTRSVVALTKHAIPHIKARKGTIVNVSSINGPCSFPGVTYYCMSKAALDQFTKCLALEMAPFGVRVNSVNPGVVITAIHKRAGMDEAKYAAFLEHSKTTHALGRVGRPAEVAKAIAFLASDDSSFTTGELLRVDGGRGIMSPR